MEYQDEDARILEDMEQDAVTADYNNIPLKDYAHDSKKIEVIGKPNGLTNAIGAMVAVSKEARKNRKDIPLGEYSTNEPEEHQCENFSTFN